MILDIEPKTNIFLLGFGAYRILEFIIYHVQLCSALLNLDVSNRQWRMTEEGGGGVGARVPVCYF